MRSLDQLRAARAYQVMESASSELVDLAQKLPALLRTNGLLATWAFCLAKEGAQYEQCLERALLPHLREEVLGLAVPAGSPAQVFRSWVEPETALSGLQLRRLTEEATAFAGWIKRAAEAAG